MHIIQTAWPYTLLWGAQERLLRIPLELPAGVQSAPALLLPLCVTRVFAALPTGAHTLAIGWPDIKKRALSIACATVRLMGGRLQDVHDIWPASCSGC